MKKILFVLAFSAMGFAAQAQCSKTCGNSTNCDVKKGTASVTTTSDNAMASVDNKSVTNGKNTAVGSKKRRSRKASK